VVLNIRHDLIERGGTSKLGLAAAEEIAGVYQITDE
jgi:hypothetical protein